MPSISIPAAIATGVGAIGSVASGIIGSGAASSAAAAQQAAYAKAQQATQQYYQDAVGFESPYRDLGSGAASALATATGTNPGGDPSSALLTSRFTPADLAATPGYQFSLQQGLEATQNGFAAQGLGTSGAAIKGAGQYAEGLAGTTYQQQFTNDLAYKNQVYNQLYNESALGQTAAQTSAGAANAAGTATANEAIGSGTAQAGGIVGSANALTGGIGGLSSAIGGGAYTGAFGNLGYGVNSNIPVNQQTLNQYGSPGQIALVNQAGQAAGGN